MNSPPSARLKPPSISRMRLIDRGRLSLVRADDAHVVAVVATEDAIAPRHGTLCWSAALKSPFGLGSAPVTVLGRP
jgi:hypothetical protein